MAYNNDMYKTLYTTPKYFDNWVALSMDQKRILAFGKDLKKVVEEANKNHPKSKPLMVRIPKNPGNAFIF